MHRLGRGFCRIVSNSAWVRSHRRAGNYLRPAALSLSQNQREILSQVELPSTGEMDWKQLRQYLKTTNRQVNDVNIDGLILSFFAAAGNIAASKSYLHFMEQSEDGKQPNVLVKSVLLRCYQCATFYGYKLTPEDDQLIQRIYDEVKAKYEVLDAATNENLIGGLSLTSRWRECLQLLEDCKITAKPSRSSYTMVIKAAFEEDDPTVARRLMEEVVQGGIFPSPTMYSACTAWCRKQANFAEEIESVLAFIGENELTVSKDVVKDLVEAVAGAGGRVKETKISRR